MNLKEKITELKDWAKKQDASLDLPDGQLELNTRLINLIENVIDHPNLKEVEPYKGALFLKDKE